MNRLILVSLILTAQHCLSTPVYGDLGDENISNVKKSDIPVSRHTDFYPNFAEQRSHEVRTIVPHTPTFDHSKHDHNQLFQRNFLSEGILNTELGFMKKRSRIASDPNIRVKPMSPREVIALHEIKKIIAPASAHVRKTENTKLNEARRSFIFRQHAVSLAKALRSPTIKSFLAFNRPLFPLPVKTRSNFLGKKSNIFTLFHPNHGNNINKGANPVIRRFVPFKAHPNTLKSFPPQAFHQAYQPNHRFHPSQLQRSLPPAHRPMSQNRGHPVQSNRAQFPHPMPQGSLNQINWPKPYITIARSKPVPHHAAEHKLPFHVPQVPMVDRRLIKHNGFRVKTFPSELRNEKNPMKIYSAKAADFSERKRVWQAYDKNHPPTPSRITSELVEKANKYKGNSLLKELSSVTMRAAPMQWSGYPSSNTNVPEWLASLKSVLQPAALNAALRLPTTPVKKQLTAQAQQQQTPPLSAYLAQPGQIPWNYRHSEFMADGRVRAPLYPIAKHLRPGACLPEGALCDRGLHRQCCGPITFCTDFWGVSKCVAHKKTTPEDYHNFMKIDKNNSYKNYFDFWLNRLNQS